MPYARRGLTLIELVAVIGAGSVVFGVATSLLILLLRTEQLAREEVHQTTVLSHLAEQFRHDVRLANAVEEEAAEGAQPPRWRLETAESEIVYAGGRHAIERRETRRDEGTRRETFQLPADARWSIVRARDGLVGLLIEPGPASSPRRCRPNLRIEAALGGERRFSAVENQESQP